MQQQQQQGDIQNGGGGQAMSGGGGGGALASTNSPPGTYGTSKRAQISGGRFDFEDGGTYCGGWDDGKAHGHGVCTGPKHQGAYAGAWNYGFELSGVYIWPSGSHYEGQWQNGRRHGLGVEQRGRLIYRGEWSKDGHKGRYGVRQSTISTAKYEGTWNVGFQDGYGCETYADGGTYQGQWQEGKRHGYGIRTSAPFGMASHYRPKNIHASMSSLRSNENADPGGKGNNKSEEIRGGFVLTSKSDKLPARRNSLTEKSKKGFLSGLRRKQRSTGDLEKRGTLASGSIRSTMSTASWLSTGSEQSNLTAKSAHTESNASFTIEEEQLDPTVVETYMGEWSKDKRSGYGVAERTDGLKYEGEWYNNKKNGYGVTTFRDGTVEEGKYKNNILITSQKKKHLFVARSRKFRERITASVSSAQRALKMALQRSDIAISRTATASAKAQNADIAAEQARIDCEQAVAMAREFAPDFKPTVLERFEKLRFRERYKLMSSDMIEPNRPSGSSNNPQLMGNQANEAARSVANTASQQPQQQIPNKQPMSAFQQPQQSQQQNKQQQQQQSTTNGRRPSQQQQSDDCPIPSSMYSQQMPVSPQTDLSALVSQQHNRGPGGLHPMHVGGGLPNQSHSNPQMNPAYQFQQQQPPGSNLSNSANFAANEQINNLQQQQMLQLQLQQQHQQQQQLYNQQQQQQSQLAQQQQKQQQQQFEMQHQQQQQMSSQQQSNMQQQQQQQQQMQQQQQYRQDNLNSTQAAGGSGSMIRRNGSSRPPMLGQTNQQSSIDHFDHYKRPPSRDSSVDRYARAASRMSGGYGSRQASVDRQTSNAAPGTSTPTETTTMGNETARPRAGSVFRGATPGPRSATPTGNTGNGTVPTGSGRLSLTGTPSMQRRSTPIKEPQFSTPNQPFEDVLLRQRTLGQDIIPSPSQPKRTESLYVPPKPATPIGGGGGGGKAAGGASGGNKKLKSVPINVTLQRKKSLPDFQELPRATEAMSREEVSALGSARREAVRRQIEMNERLKANPFLYLVSPQVKDWFSRQQLVILVLFANIALGIMFFKMLT
ncbi:junctophilin-1 [Episyrphus balteatus]|uniref:junctophilin-1 n=1 Tax=Episyrphus balteatus TaxID=286459 RepID=UPI002484E3DA|nr:junctophilin-1 [Episyrphus balteatus]XP_055848890.1 junctophilin-1 [Episyrphus balteatus]XP_055848891.1 junctophilin-1 [Episyrphus balteatus]XP_055848892.1 junctophilin-1 [Episyrphus balteatus]XP_055848893.1 junctophilin-1 [Episyrphus balteatus]